MIFSVSGTNRYVARTGHTVKFAVIISAIKVIQIYFIHNRPSRYKIRLLYLAKSQAPNFANRARPRPNTEHRNTALHVAIQKPTVI
jgi:hypothetical protein